jgi:hypothetical protein
MAPQKRGATLASKKEAAVPARTALKKEWACLSHICFAHLRRVHVFTCSMWGHTQDNHAGILFLGYVLYDIYVCGSSADVHLACVFRSCLRPRGQV